ncbi:MAG: hypothetical protein ACKVKF_01055 [Rhodobacterales bacterium]
MTYATGSDGLSFLDPMKDLGDGLYAFSIAGPMWLYVLTMAPPQAGAALTFDRFWQTGVGWCLFTPVDLAQVDIPAFATEARRKLPPIVPQTGNANAFVWLRAAGDFDNKMFMQWIPGSKPREGTGGCSASFDCDRFSIALNAQIGASGALSFLLNDKGGGAPASMTLLCDTANVSVTVDGLVQTAGYPVNPRKWDDTAWVCQIAFDGPQTGSLAMPLALDLGTLADQFGLETVYQYNSAHIADGAPRSDDLHILRMPLFAPKAPAPTDQKGLCAFNVLLNPSRPHRPEAAGLRIDRAGRMLGGTEAAGPSNQASQVANARALVSPYGAAVNGAVVALTPADPLEEGLPFDAYIGGGFAYSPPLAAVPGDAAPTPMSPAGVFLPSMETPGEQRTRATAQAPLARPIDMMPGLFALDFVRLAEGDRINFEPQHPAYIPPPDSAPVQGGLTTSYVSVRKGPATTGRAYFGQSRTANLFLPDETAAEGFLFAALAQLSPLEKTPAFPMLFVGAVFLEHPGRGPINPDVTAALIGRLDQKALGPKRHSRLLDAPNGAKVILPTALSVRERMNGSDTHPVITPQGYIVNVNANGIFTDVTLGVGTGTAISPNALRFDGTGDPKKVAPAVSTLLTRENLFLVASKVDPAWNFQNRIEVAGFEFAVALDGVCGGIETGSRPSILIIKLDPVRTLREMALDPTSWTDGGAYVDDVDGIVARLAALFAAADPEKAVVGEDPFTAFRGLLDNAAWTGVIAFDTPIDGNGMPPDLQMLLGGIPGQLVAHHVGIQTSKVTAAKVAQSSVFGVINYHRDASSDTDGPPPEDPQYEVAELVAQIGNSAIVQLHVTVDLIVKTLLGRDVVLPVTQENPKGDTLSIKGRYQVHGDIGRVIFVSENAFVFSPVVSGDGTVRIVESIRITHASLVPVTAGEAGQSRVEDADVTHVAANFTLDGELFFDADPFAGSGGLDLFSYGTPLPVAGGKEHGLAFSGLTVSIDFDLDAQGAMIASSKQVLLHETTLTPKATPTAVRPHSLLGSLPMQLTAFEVADPATKTRVAGRAKAVNVLELMAPRPADDGPSGDGDARSAASPFTTNTPTYGLTYNISLGSLGSLSDAHAGMSAALTIAWGPSPTVPDSDAACVMVALPSLSAGYQGFDLQGFISTKFQTANLLKVAMDDGRNVYAMSFDNVQLAVFGFGLPPGVMIDFVLFSGNSADAQAKVTDASSIGWMLSATTDKGTEAQDEHGQ